MIDKSTLSKLAKEAYETIFNQSEDQIVSAALANYSDQEDQEDYIESYLVIFQQGWVNFIRFRGAVNAHLGENEKLSLSQLEESLREDYQIRTVRNSIVGTAYKYIRPIEGHEDDILPEEVDAEVEVGIKVPELSEEERKHFVSLISRVVTESPNQSLLMAKLGPELEEKLHYKSLGFRRLIDLLDQFQEDFDIFEDANGAKCVCLKGAPQPETPVKVKPVARVETQSVPKPGEMQIASAKALEIIGSLSMKEHKNRTGWVNVVLVNPKLKEAGVDYKQLGFNKFRQFLESLGEKVEFDQVPPTTLMVRLRSGATPPRAVPKPTPKPAPKSAPKQETLPVKKISESPFEKLVGFAYFLMKPDGTNGFTAMLNELEEKCLAENWEFQGHKILQDYLLFTFERILFEDERSLKQGRSKDCLKLKQGKSYAIFNTGLVNSYYSQVYALFRNSNSSGKAWVFDGFHTEEEPRMNAVRKEEGWFDLPAAARFYDKVEDIVYDVTYQINAVNWEHIIIDNVERIPPEYVRQNAPRNFVVEADPEKPIEYYDRLREAVKDDDFCYRKMVKLFTDAMDRSVKHVNWNFHYAIPIYYPRRHKVSMLLPLNLGDTRDNKADLALVLERDAESHSYIATTIMTLQQVYCNVRLIAKVDDSSNWLKPTE